MFEVLPLAFGQSDNEKDGFQQTAMPLQPGLKPDEDGWNKLEQPTERVHSKCKPPDTKQHCSKIMQATRPEESRMSS